MTSRKRKFMTNVGRFLPALFALALVTATAAHAQVVGGGTDPTTILTAITTFILGPFGQALAVLCCVAVGVGMMAGRLHLLGLGAFIGGLCIVFGASFLVNQFLGAAG